MGVTQGYWPEPVQNFFNSNNQTTPSDNFRTKA